jgi:hypothetical protein
VRIGTWNLAGRWSAHHADLLLAADCDLWLLTEVSERTTLPGYTLHVSTTEMARKRRWAGVASRLPLWPEPDPHPASARAQVGSFTCVSSVLPWRSATKEPWVGDRHADRTDHAVATLTEPLKITDRLVWGGDWNHALTGREYAGSQGGRRAIEQALDRLRLDVPTAELPHRIDGLRSIDHVAVPQGWSKDATRLIAEQEHDGKRLSDHDAYVVEVEIS